MVEAGERSSELTAQYAVLLAAVRDAVLLTDATGRTTEVNLGASSLFGREPRDLVGRLPDEVVALPPGGRSEILAAMASGRRWSGPVTFVRPDGSPGLCDASVDPVFVDGRLVGTVGICRDVTEQRSLGAALAEAEQRWRLTLDHAPVGIALVGLNGRFLHVNAALCRLVGLSQQELLALTFQEITFADDLSADLELLGRLIAGDIASYEMDKRYVHAQGHLVWISLSVGLVRSESGQPLHLVAHIQDITERRARTARLERLASRDELTGLANRVLFHERLRQQLADGGRLAVGYLDLDGFKAVNDAYGHAAGDELLRQAASRIASALRPADVAARLGGDEFAVLLPDVQTTADVEAIGARLLGALSAGFRIETGQSGPVELTAGVSVGLAMADPTETGPRLLARADAAMYRAKAAGTNRYELG